MRRCSCASSLSLPQFHLIHTNTVTGHKLNEHDTRTHARTHARTRQGCSHAPKLPSALLGAPTDTAVSTPPVGDCARNELASSSLPAIVANDCVTSTIARALSPIMHPADRFGRRPPPRPASEMTARRAATSRAKSRIQIQNPECGWRPECKGRATSKFRLQTWNPYLDYCNRAESESRIRSADGPAGGVVARRPPRRKTQNPESRSQAFCLLEFGSDVLHLHTCSTRYSADQACRIQIMRIQMDFARCHTCQQWRGGMATHVCGL